MKIAAAIITDTGGRACHAAIIARELGITAIVGTGDATQTIKEGQEVTISCAEGDQGMVYPGVIPFQIDELNIKDLPRPKIRVMLNLGNPDLAFKTALLPSDGVGLARMEFIIAEHTKAHLMALLHPEQITDPKVPKTCSIERVTTTPRPTTLSNASRRASAPSLRLLPQTSSGAHARLQEQ